jgi:hypothetical protein
MSFLILVPDPKISPAKASKAITANCFGSLPGHFGTTKPAIPPGCAEECATVLMVSVTGSDDEPLTAALAGLNAQLAPVGNPLVHAKATEPLNPSRPETFKLKLAD